MPILNRPPGGPAPRSLADPRWAPKIGPWFESTDPYPRCPCLAHPATPCRASFPANANSNLGWIKRSDLDLMTWTRTFEPTLLSGSFHNLAGGTMILGPCAGHVRSDAWKCLNAGSPAFGPGPQSCDPAKENDICGPLGLPFWPTSKWRLGNIKCSWLLQGLQIPTRGSPECYETSEYDPGPTHQTSTSFMVNTVTPSWRLRPPVLLVAQDLLYVILRYSSVI